MKIKKYEGTTEKQVMLKVKEELGKEALIVNVKRIKPKGIYKLFKKPYVEVTAALDDKAILENEVFDNQAINKKYQADEEVNDGEFIQFLKKLSYKAEQEENDQIEVDTVVPEKPNILEKVKNDPTISNTPLMKLVYEQLLENEIVEENANLLMRGLEELSSNGTIDDLVSVIYKRIVHQLSDIQTIELVDNIQKTVVFIGPTGVGKTTTIAKIASYFTLNMSKKVGLITADTYRIAAVEQLRTYADILNIPIKVIYNKNELEEAIKSFNHLDLILIDTAGRSHKNKEHQNELSKLLNAIHEKEVFLVLSLGTKYSDLLKITEAYNDISNFKLIFTKLDETSSFGNILNIKLNTNAKLSYVTFGQNVPDDISEANVHDIAKKILSGGES